MHEKELTFTPHFLKLLAHDVRWQLLSGLSAGDKRVNELVAVLQRPQNLVSYHLRLLRDAGLVVERRSSADGRDVYYSLDLPRLQQLYQESGSRLHPALVAPPFAGAEMLPRAKRPFRVLFLCTHNSARSQMAEGILQARGGNRVEAHSAGSHPGRVHPLAIATTAGMGIDIRHQRSQDMQQFIDQQFDAVITVCDRVREVCPIFPHEPPQIHWSLPDPAAVAGGEAAITEAFRQTAVELEKRIHYFLQTIPL